MSDNAGAPPRHPKGKLVAVASSGGHWIQLLRLRPAFHDCEVAFVTTNAGYRVDVPGHRFYAVNDASRWNKIAAVWMSVRMLIILLRERPRFVISTGAAPGYVALRLGRLMGARTIWIDSIANVEELSLSGRRIGRHADLWLTQWPHLAAPEGPRYAGAVL